MRESLLSKGFPQIPKSLSIVKKYERNTGFLLAVPRHVFLASLKSRNPTTAMHTILRPFLALAFAGSLTSLATAQEMPKRSEDNKMIVDKPAFDDLQSPNIQTGNSKRFRPKDWLEVEVKIKPGKFKQEPKDGYLDAITVKWFIVVKGTDRKSYMMKKEIEYVNIPFDEDTYVSVYLSPNTLKRITGKDRAGKNSLEAVGGEIHYGGEMVGFFSHGQQAGWWVRPLKNTERTEKFPLLDKSETPFSFLWYDRYAEIKPKAR